MSSGMFSGRSTVQEIIDRIELSQLPAANYFATTSMNVGSGT